MQEQEKEAVKLAFQKKQPKKKLIVFLIVLIFSIVIIILSFFLLLYLQTPEHKLSLGANIEEARISQDGKNIYLKLVGGSNDKNITAVKFIFKSAGKEYSYETSEGTKEISEPFKRSFWQWLLRKPKYEGEYDYEIKADEAEIENFNNVWEVSVVFEYETETEKPIEPSELNTTKTTPTPTTTPSGGGGGGGDGSNGGDGTCTPSCQGKQCGDDGCGGSCGSCSAEKECRNGQCELIIPNCLINLQITSSCLCFGTERSRGYCCAFGYQETPCDIFEADYYVDYSIADCTTYNVSTRTCGNGDKTAFDTIQEAVNTVQAGGTIAVREGIYRESITLKTSGTANSRITIKNYPGETPVIDGSEVLTGWKKCQSQQECGDNLNWQKLYYTLTNYSGNAFLSNLYQDDEMLYLSQYPDPKDRLYMDDISTYLNASYVNQNSIIDSRLNGIEEELNESYVAIWTGSNNVENMKIVGFDVSQDKIIFNAPSYDFNRSGLAYYSIINNINEKILDKEGEYYFNETKNADGNYKVYLWPLYNQDLSVGGEVTISVRERLIHFSNMKHITVEGFKIQKSIEEKTIFSGWNGVDGVIFRNNELTKSRDYEAAGHLVDFWGNNTLIENNYLHDNVGPLRGIGLVGYNNSVSNNLINRIGRTTIDVSGSKNTRVVNNTIVNCTGVHSNGITAYGSEPYENTSACNILIANNKVVRSNILITIDYACNITIYNNLLLGEDQGGSLIADWGGMSGIVSILNNIILGSNNDAAIHTNPGPIYIIKNNIIDGAALGNHSHNIFVSTYALDSLKEGEILGQENNSADMSEIFVNSPAVEAQITDAYKMIAEGSGNNTNVIYLRDKYYKNIKEDNFILYEKDSIIRTVSENATCVVYKGNGRTKVSFAPVIENLKPCETYGLCKIEVWKDINNLTKDYHLKQGSLAIDNGNDISEYLPEAYFPDYNFFKDIEGNPRPRGDGWDIGAYEYTGNTSFPLLPLTTGTSPSLSPLAKILNWIKSLLTAKTGNAITGNVISETNNLEKPENFITKIINWFKEILER